MIHSPEKFEEIGKNTTNQSDSNLDISISLSLSLSVGRDCPASYEDAPKNH